VGNDLAQEPWLAADARTAALVPELSSVQLPACRLGNAYLGKAVRRLAAHAVELANDAGVIAGCIPSGTRANCLTNSQSKINKLRPSATGIHGSNLTTAGPSGQHPWWVDQDFGRHLLADSPAAADVEGQSMDDSSDLKLCVSVGRPQSLRR
jgi:hypothetical protein